MELELTLVKYEAEKKIERSLTQTNIPEVGGTKENIGPCTCPFSLLVEAKYASNPLNPPLRDEPGSRSKFSTMQSTKKLRLRVYSAPRPEHTMRSMDHISERVFYSPLSHRKYPFGCHSSKSAVTKDWWSRWKSVITVVNLHWKDQDLSKSTWSRRRGLCHPLHPFSEKRIASKPAQATSWSNSLLYEC